LPNIEIITVRFNLDKDDDRRIFEELQKRSDPGKRNDFLKQVLLGYLAGNSMGGKSGARASKKQTKERYGPPDDLRQPEVSRSALTGATGLEPPQTPVVDAPSDGPVSRMVASAEEPDPEATGLVGSFVQ
jgi:hypothetical protein